MKIKKLLLLAGGLFLILLSGQVPYLAVDFGLREAIYRSDCLTPLLPWIKYGFPIGILVLLLFLGLRLRSPTGTRLRWTLVLLVLAYTFVPLSMNSAVLTLSMVLGLGGFLLSATALRRAGPTSPWVRIPMYLWSWCRSLTPARFALGLFVAGLVLHIVISGLVFAFRPCIIDTFDQIFQARTYLTGRVTAPAPPVPRAFEYLYMIIQDGKWYSHYPPGNPLLLTLGLTVGAAWLVGPLLGALLPLLLLAIGRQVWGERTGRVAGLLGLGAPYLHLMAGSHMSHTACAFFLTLGALGGVRLARGGGYGSALMTGFGFGYALWTRPYTALVVTCAAGLGGVWMVFCGGRVRFRTLPLVVLTAAVPVGLLLLYNQATNGHPLVFGYNITQGPLHKLGFGVRRMNEIVRDYTLWDAVKQTGYHLNGLNVLALGTAIPGILLCPWTFLARRRHPFDWIFLILATAPVAAFFIYPFTDFVLGPRLVFSALPFGILLVARSLIRFRRVSFLPGRLAPTPVLVSLLFLPALPALVGAMSFNMRLLRPGYDRIRDTLASEDLGNALVLCDTRVFNHYGFAQLHPGLPPDRPIFARDVNSADLVKKFPGRPVRRLAYEASGGLALETHQEPFLDLHDWVARGQHPRVLQNDGMAAQTLTFTPENASGVLKSFLGETHALLYGFKTPAAVQFKLTLPTSPFLRFSCLVYPESWARGSDGITFRVRLKTPGMKTPVELFSRFLERTSPSIELLDQEIDLGPYAGVDVLLWVEALPGPEGNAVGDIFDISNLRIVRRTRP